MLLLMMMLLLLVLFRGGGGGRLEKNSIAYRQGTSKRGEGRPRLENCISTLCPSPLGSPPPPTHPNRLKNT